MKQVHKALINLRQAITSGSYTDINKDVGVLLMLLLSSFPSIDDTKGQQIYVESLHLMMCFKMQMMCTDVLVAFNNKFAILDTSQILFPDNIGKVEELMVRVANELNIDLFQHYLYFDYYVDGKIYNAVGAAALMAILGVDRSSINVQLVELISNSRYTVDFYEDGDENGIYYFEIIERLFDSNHKQTNTVFKLKSRNRDIVEDDATFVMDAISEKFRVGVDEY